MTGWLRTLVVAIRSTLRREPVPFFDESAIDFRVWPQEADISIMNNSRYGAVMEAARFDLLLRSGMLRVVLDNRIQMLAGAFFIQYRKPLRRFERFTVRTRVVHFEGPWFFVRQRLERKNQLVAQGLVSVLCIRKGKKLDAIEVLRLGALEPRVLPPDPQIEALKALIATLPKE